MKKWLLIILCVVGCRHFQAQTYEEMVRKSYVYADSADFAAAEECLKAAMRLEPANKLNFALLTNLGTLQRRQGKLDDALLSYTAALNLQPKNELILLNRAELYTMMDETEKALYDYNTLLAEKPLHERGLYERGILYVRKGELLLAQTDFETIIDNYKETFYGRLGFAIFEKARENYDASETILNYLEDNFPENIRVYEERAELYFLTKRNGRAMRDLNRVFAVVKVPSAEMYMLRGRIKLAQYEKESAAIDFKKALDLGYDKETVERLLKEAY